jgi:hypothetical protein
MVRRRFDSLGVPGRFRQSGGLETSATATNQPELEEEQQLWSKNQA